MTVAKINGWTATNLCRDRFILDQKSSFEKLLMSMQLKRAEKFFRLPIVSIGKDTVIVEEQGWWTTDGGYVKRPPLTEYCLTRFFNGYWSKKTIEKREDDKCVILFW